ncbi:hypothetical protein ACFVMC_26690 [Nocardia sp. NPDC127579]|uniref:sigma-70 region 4 domain-containing protein n=1 Tax=Nocardia sp. NPDC127579 TaxID=3345402 RepID=UPI00362C38A3
MVVLALPAFVAIWSGWVGLGQLTGFGPVQPLPGIWDDLTINTAITLPIGMEAYASYALYVWLSGRIRSDNIRSYSKYSALGALLLGAGGQIAYHLMKAADVTTAPWPATVFVACLPVVVLGMGAALAHMILREHHGAHQPEPVVQIPESAVHTVEPVRTVSVRETRTETLSTSAEVAVAPAAVAEIESRAQIKNGASAPADQWAAVAAQLCGADPAGRRDPNKVAEILHLRHDEGLSHARIAERVQVSSSTVTRTLTAAQEYTMEGGH